MFKFAVGWFVFWTLTALVSLAAWITHVIVCIMAAEWLLLIAGAIMVPIGVVHGIGVWFGVW